VEIPTDKATEKEVKIDFNAYTGGLNSVQVGGEELLAAPLKLNILRYTDNERLNLAEYAEFDMRHSKGIVVTEEEKDGKRIFNGVIASNCNDPSVYYTIAYEQIKGGLKIKLKYKIAPYVKRIPRIGLEFALPKNYDKFSYVGFGPYESYIDKNCLCEYGYYSATAESNFVNYIRPQENGSHYHTEYLKVDGAFSVTAEKPFSFSVLPFTSEQFFDAKHAFELKRKGLVNVCIDLAMRGVGTHSCGPELAKEFEVPREGENEFMVIFQ
jgi:beta-galactosidase